MSKRFWEEGRTTSGHGVVSQYKPQHLKEWVQKETRRLGDESKCPEASTRDLSLYRTSLFGSGAHPHVERLHNYNSKSLAELKKYQTEPASKEANAREPKKQISRVRFDEPTTLRDERASEAHYPPHFVHHHHFGWKPPTAQTVIGVPGSRIGYRRSGEAMKCCQEITSKHKKITTRKA
ncbi:hypothetical protein BSKO_13114 [Bryopsis sp. KO-2023]|nr:hypothetical protein BSKO_13114 [Bryopsis sp. KO-2023]